MVTLVRVKVPSAGNALRGKSREVAVSDSVENRVSFQLLSNSVAHRRSSDCPPNPSRKKSRSAWLVASTYSENGSVDSVPT